MFFVNEPNSSENQKATAIPRHARYLEPNVAYHVIFKTTQGLLLLKPDAKGKLRRVVAGVLARAKEQFSGVKNHGTSILANHGHMLITGTHPADIAAYVGFVKREISRRWGPQIGWRGIFEPRYLASAVLTEEAQIGCLKYILSQGVKEGLVEDPRDWPGFHCANTLMTGTPIRGEWLDGSAFAHARLAARRAKKSQKAAERNTYLHNYEFVFDPLPALAAMAPREQNALMRRFVSEIMIEGKILRKGRPFVGARAIVAQELRFTPTRLASQNEHEEPHRSRMIVWDTCSDERVRDYVRRYWNFQRCFHDASMRWRQGEHGVVFPANSWLPGIPPQKSNVANLTLQEL